MDQQIVEHERRLTALERAQSDLYSEFRISEVRREHIDAQFNHIDTRFNKLDSNISRVVWLVLASIVGGFVSFVLKGGLGLV